MSKAWPGGRGTGAGLAMRACPNCSESRQDHLWPLGSEVRCDECGQRYKLELAPSRTPSQRAQDIRANDSTIDLDTQCALDALEDMIAEQGVRIDGLHDLIEQQQQGATYSARKVDKLEAFQRRAIERFPSLGETTDKEDDSE